MGNRTLVISDIHGCSKTFKRQLDVIQLERTDTLYLIGDYIDRGPDSKGVIDIILNLQRDGYDLCPLLGNHEDLLLTALETSIPDDLELWLYNGGDETLLSYRVEHPRDIPEEHLKFMEELPVYRVTDRFVFVHAGIDCSLDDPYSGKGHLRMLWDRSGIVDIGKLGGRRVVSGHTTRKLDDIKKSVNKNHIRIDNGVYLTGSQGKGNLIAVDLDTKQIYVQPNIDEMAEE